MAKRSNEGNPRKSNERSRNSNEDDLSSGKKRTTESKRFNFKSKENDINADRPYSSRQENNKRKTRTNLKKEAKKRLEGEESKEDKAFSKKSDYKSAKEIKPETEKTSTRGGKDRRTNLKKRSIDFRESFDEPESFKRKKTRKTEHRDDAVKGKSQWMEEIPSSWKSKKEFKPKKRRVETLEEKDGRIRLNKYISNAGICSRREADELIKSGAVKVNGKVVTEMGYRISPDDKVQYGDQTLSKEQKRYLLLNKPKDYITTAFDPDGRKTVMELVAKACKERLYPVGRLDRATTGLLLFTNDGELARKLTHPSHEIKKVYHVTLNKNLKAIDLKRIMEGLELEDGIAQVDSIDWANDGKTKNEVGIELHSGKNRIVRRIFEHLGYEVVKLDRTYFAGLTKKDLSRGNYRFLTEKELIMLKMS